MQTHWTRWAAERLLPFPGEPWTVKVALKKSASRVQKAGGGEVGKVSAEEVQRAARLRVNECYTAVGSYARDPLGEDLVDLWVAAAGLEFALSTTIAVCKLRRVPNMSKMTPHHYDLRRDAAPWGRLREHLVTADSETRKRALAVAVAAYDPKDTAGDLPFALAFLTCNQSWVDAQYASAIQHDEWLAYGRNCLLASIDDPARARPMLRAMIAAGRFQLPEHGVEFMPTLMKVLTDSDVELVIECAETANTKGIRKPWLEVVRSLPAAHPAVKGYLAEFA